MEEPFLRPAGSVVVSRRQGAGRIILQSTRRNHRPCWRERRRQVDADEFLGRCCCPDERTINIDGEIDHAAVHSATSMAAGIAFVHQELNLFDNLTSPPTSLLAASRCGAGRCGCLTHEELSTPAHRPLLQQLGADFLARGRPSRSCRWQQKQMVEIAKARSLEGPADDYGRADMSLTPAKPSASLWMIRRSESRWRQRRSSFRIVLRRWNTGRAGGGLARRRAHVAELTKRRDRRHDVM